MRDTEAESDDHELLRDYCATRAEGAFSTLVERHLPAVWSAARRMVNGDGALAEDIAQEVFAHLAVQAPKLPPRVVLGGWLHRHTCFTATKAVRSAVRRRARELEHATAMTDAATPVPDLWPEVEPHLDAALNALPATDRDAVVLRFFEQSDYRAIAAALGTSEETARRKTSRAVEKLRGLLGKRSALATVTLLTGLLTDKSVASPPAGMAGSVVRNALTHASGAAAVSGWAGLMAKLRPHRAAVAGGAVLLLAVLALWQWYHLMDGGEKRPHPVAAGPPVAIEKPKAASLPAAAQVVQLAVHYLYVPESKAAALMNARWNGDGDSALLKSLLQQAGRDPAGVQLAALLTGDCPYGQRVKLEKTKEFSWTDKFGRGEKGAIEPEGSAVRQTGTAAQVEVTVGKDGEFCDLNMALDQDYAEPAQHHFSSSLTDSENGKSPGIGQPEFRIAKVTTQLMLKSGETGLAHSSQLPSLPGIPARRIFVFMTPGFPGGAADLETDRPERVKQVQVRTVTFEKAGAATALAAAAPGCDESLYAGLTADAAAGRAVCVHDQTVIVRGGQRSRSEALRQFPWLTKSTSEPAEGWNYPWSITLQNLGHTLEAEATVGELKKGWPQHPLDLNLRADSGALLSQHSWPVPDFRGAGRMGRMSQPVFASLQETAQILTWTGRTLLVSVAPAPGAAFAEAAEPSFCYTFLRAGLDGEKPGPASDERPPLLDQRRLHAVTIRMPRGEAAKLMLRTAGDDAALYAAAHQMVTAGAASVSSHCAVLCRGNQRAKIQSHAEFHYPEESEGLIPQKWSELLPGSHMEVEAATGRVEIKKSPNGREYARSTPSDEEDGSGPGAQWRVHLEMREAPEQMAYYPSAKHAEVHGAAIACGIRKLSELVRIPVSGVLCGAVVSTSPATEDEEAAPEGLTDITFLMQSPSPGTAGTAPARQTLLQAVILSLPAEEQGTVKPGESAGPLLERLLSGKVRCAAHAAVALREGAQATVEHTREVPQPEDFVPAAVDGTISLPGSWQRTSCGLVLTAGCAAAAKGITVNGSVEWDTAAPAGFGAPGATVPEMSVRRNVQKIEFKALTLTPRAAVIADVRESNAREGAPEHGRWHVTVLLAR